MIAKQEVNTVETDMLNMIFHQNIPFMEILISKNRQKFLMMNVLLIMHTVIHLPMIQFIIDIEELLKLLKILILYIEWLRRKDESDERLYFFNNEAF